MSSYYIKDNAAPLYYLPYDQLPAYHESGVPLEPMTPTPTPDHLPAPAPAIIPAEEAVTFSKKQMTMAALAFPALVLAVDVVSLIMLLPFGGYLGRTLMQIFPIAWSIPQIIATLQGGRLLEVVWWSSIGSLIYSFALAIFFRVLSSPYSSLFFLQHLGSVAIWMVVVKVLLRMEFRCCDEQDGE